MPSFGVILCCAIYPVDGKAYIIVGGRKGADDKNLVKRIRDELDKFDCLIGFNSLNFDCRFLNSRLLKWGLKRLPDKFHVDLYRIAKGIFKTTKYTSCSLKSICGFLGISGKGGEKKGNVDAELWLKATLSNDKYAMGQIEKHCLEDVAVLEPLFDKLKDRMRSISKS